jgi:integrase
MLTRLYADLLEHGRRDRDGLSRRSVRYLHAIVRGALSDARRWGLVTHNVAEQADPPRQDRNRDAMRTWSAEQVRAFLDHVGDDRLCTLWLLLVSTGMRRGEACGLHWDDLDLEAARVAVRRNLTAVRGRGPAREASWSEPKTSRSRRSVALDANTVEQLRAHRRRQLEERLAAGPAYVDRGLVFCREDGSELDPDWVSKRFERLADAAGLPRIRLHDLRHTHATLALQAGVHVKVVSERLGHATVGMTLDTYSHVIPAMQEDAAQRVAALVFGD